MSAKIFPIMHTEKKITHWLPTDCKKILIFLFIVCLSCSKDGVNDIGSGTGIVGSWMMVEANNYQMNAGDKIEDTKGKFTYDEPIYVEFKENGQVLTLDAGGKETSSGSYSINNSPQQLQLKNGPEIAAFDIIKLSPTEMRLSVTYENESGKTLNEIILERFNK
jgi:hypothetical protein